LTVLFVQRSISFTNYRSQYGSLSDFDDVSDGYPRGEHWRAYHILHCCCTEVLGAEAPTDEASAVGLHDRCVLGGLLREARRRFVADCRQLFGLGLVISENFTVTRGAVGQPVQTATVDEHLFSVKVWELAPRS
jgi:hypothetical protein